MIYYIIYIYDIIYIYIIVAQVTKLAYSVLPPFAKCKILCIIYNIIYNIIAAQVTKLAYSQVTVYGFNERIGSISFQVCRLAGRPARKPVK